MGLVNELQESAERDDVLTVLRKAKRLSSKLSRQDMSDWLDHEQNGYPAEVELPKYRTVRAQICYNTNGYIPAGGGMMHNGVIPLQGAPLVDADVREPIGEVMVYVEEMDKTKRGIYRTTPQALADHLKRTISGHSDTIDQLTFLTRLNDYQLRDIPEQVKNRVLDWALKLEAAGVTGNDQSFTAKEKQLAESIILNVAGGIDQSNNVHVGGSATGVQVGNSDSSQNVQVQTHSEVTTTFNNIREAIKQSDLTQLDKEDATEALDRAEDLAKREKTPGVLTRIKDKLSVVQKIAATSAKLGATAAPWIAWLVHHFHT